MSHRRATMPEAEAAVAGGSPARRGWLRRAAGLLDRWIDLRLAVVLALLLGLALPWLWFSLVDARSAEARATAHLRADLEQVTDILAAAMRDPLWQIAPELGRPLLQAMFRDERLVAVVVHEATSDQPFLDIYRSVSATAPALTHSRSIVFEGRELGSIRVTMSTGPALARHQRELEGFELRFWTSTLGAVLLVLLVLHWRLVRPLAALVAALRRPDEGGRRLAGNWSGADELRPLVAEIARLERRQKEQGG